MAKVKGGDVFLELMDTVRALEKSTAEQARRLSVLEDNVAFLSDEVARLSVGFHNLRGSIAAMKEGAEETNSHVRRMAQLLVATQRETINRFSSLDDRVTRLERKTG